MFSRYKSVMAMIIAGFLMLAALPFAAPASAVPMQAGVPYGCDAYTLPGHTPHEIGGGWIQGDVYVRCNTLVYIRVRGYLVSASTCHGYSSGSKNVTGSWVFRYEPDELLWDDSHFEFCGASGSGLLPIRTSGGAGGGAGGGGGGPW